MNIGLMNIEPKIQNTAYMQISYHHKLKGDTVEWYDPASQYDTIYCSSLFRFTDKSDVPTQALCGGTGFDLTTKLPFDCELDYSIYPECDRSFVWFSRGCIRNCAFCVVREKEGVIKSVDPKNLNPTGSHVVVMDNNFFANSNWKKALWQLWEWGQPVDFQGVDVRLLTHEMCQFLKVTRRYKQIKIAWDDPRQNLTGAIRELLRYIAPSNVMCYVLIGHNSTLEQDIYRIKKLRELKVSPYVMCMNRQDKHQKKFQRWVNGFAFRNVKWTAFTAPQ
ncbi:hypothetical protein LCGC14_0362510 [marine sediment metagenome]|uniref:Radical SAM core domain-containing protein n=1 Tax=marine sediment metagenome TaxID=412755 RepID=A0A0F9WG36_9ZZZZ